MERMKLERSNSILAILNQAKISLHVLKNTWPCGIRSIDDEVTRKIKSLEAFIQDVNNKIKAV